MEPSPYQIARSHASIATDGELERAAACWRSSSLPCADTWRRAIADEQSHRRSSRRTLA